MTTFLYLLGAIAVIAVILLFFSINSEEAAKLEKVGDEILDELIMGETPAEPTPEVVETPAEVIPEPIKVKEEPKEEAVISSQPVKKTYKKKKKPNTKPTKK